MKALPSFLVFLALSTPVAAHADTVFISQAAFNAASTGVTTVTFNGIAPAGGYVAEGTDFTIGGVNIVSSAYLNINDAAYYPTQYPGTNQATYNSGDYLSPTTGNGEAVEFFFAPSTAVSVDTGGLFGPSSILITLSDNLSITFIASDSITGTGALDFIGFTSATPITSVTLDLPGGRNQGSADNIAFGSSVASTPEPSSLILFATGLAGAIGAARRRLCA